MFLECLAGRLIVTRKSGTAIASRTSLGARRQDIRPTPHNLRTIEGL